MAISRDKKQALVSELSDILVKAKMTVAAKYDGTSVANLQSLRRIAREANVEIKVVKNRLVITAMKQSKEFKDTDTSLLNGQLLYAYSTEDEVAPAQVINNFSKDVPTLDLVAAFDNAGTALATTEVKALANLPGKNQLIAEAVAQLLSPVHDTTNALSGNLHALLDGIESKAAA
ncbi:50S ribosomal protein L10 [Candidatus Saccharibacteria bacterium]|nr:50S ribosomal protein L10 [Candidatus Saccharibacteria bacterium]